MPWSPTLVLPSRSSTRAARDSRARASRSALPRTWRRSRQRATGLSMRAPTFTRWGRCCTRCSPASRHSQQRRVSRCGERRCMSPSLRLLRVARMSRRPLMPRYGGRWRSSRMTDSRARERSRRRSPCRSATASNPHLRRRAARRPSTTVWERTGATPVIHADAWGPPLRLCTRSASCSLSVSWARRCV